MTNVFLTVLRMSLMGSLAILAVLLVRLCLRKTPKRWSWLLWAVVLLRLLVPFGIPLSVAMPALPDLSLRAETPAASEPVSILPETTGKTQVYAPAGLEPADEVPAVETPLPAADPAPAEAPSKAVDWAVVRARVLEAVPFVWLIGAALIAGWNLAALRLLRGRLAEAIPAGPANVYLTDRVDSAFVVGLFRPRIYLPAGLNPVEQACVVSHERAHIRRGDPWWRLLSFAALVVHWFNPLVWLAFRLSGQDMEMSCDEAVLRRTPVDIRAAYSRTLVKFASRGRIEGPALAFGEGETKSRVKNIMKYQKPVLWVSVAAAVVLVLTGAVLAVNLTVKDTSLPYSRYTIDEVLYFHDERTDDILKNLRLEIAGDGSVWSCFVGSDTIAWEYDTSITPIPTDGLTDFIREQTGVKIARITDAARKSNYESSSKWLFFSTASGEVYLAAVRTELGEFRSVSWLCRLANEFPGEGAVISEADTDYVKHSLNGPADRQIKTVKLAETGNSPYLVAAFTAGPVLKDLIAMEGTAEAEIPKTPGIAVFETKDNSARLLAWALAEDAVFKGESGAFPSFENPADGMYRLTLPDGRALTAEITLPETKTTLFGRTESVGDCSINFFPVEGIGADDLEAAREQGRQDAEWERQLKELQQKAAEEERQQKEAAEREENRKYWEDRCDAAFDAFLAEHYELEEMWSALAAYATRRIDLNGDGWNELIVYRMPTQSSYPLDIYEYDSLKDEVRAFHTSLEGIPASLNADPDGFYCAQIGSHDADSPDGFYGDFFSVNGETFLIAMDAGEFWQKIVCHAFTSVSGRLAAQTVFTAERYGEYSITEPEKGKAIVNGQEISFFNYYSELLRWRSTWSERMGGASVLTCQEPLWNDSEASGWPFGWLNRPRVENGTAEYWTAPGGWFTLTLPVGWSDHVVMEVKDYHLEGQLLWLDFIDKLERDEGTGPGVLGYLALDRHSLTRFYPTKYKALSTVIYPDGECYDLVLVYPGDVEYSLDIQSHVDHYYLYQTKMESVAAQVSFPTGCRTSIPPARAMELLHDALVRAYENIYGPFEPLYEDPTPEGAVSVEDSLWLRFVIARLTMSDGRTGAYEDENYYYFPIIFPFAVDKESGAIYKVYEGWDPATNSEYRQFTPFNWNDPDALAFAG
ncbi:MAG: hypothetical protein II889_06445 [Clostridia bacterium]|nr:hypothetical protein [Clostridia bacterium]